LRLVKGARGIRIVDEWVREVTYFIIGTILCLTSSVFRLSRYVKSFKVTTRRYRGKIRTEQIKICLDHFNAIEKEYCESEGISDLGRLTVGVEYEEVVFRKTWLMSSQKAT
jgi:hypothetical protein